MRWCGGAAVFSGRVVRNTRAGRTAPAPSQVYFNVTRAERSRFAAALLGFAKVDVGPAPSTAYAVVRVPLLNLAGWSAAAGNYTVGATTYGVWASPHSGVPPTAETSTWLTVTS